MSETDALGATLSPEENAYFETSGQTGIPESAPDAGGAGEATDGSGAGAGEPARDDQPRSEKMVSLSALHEERGRRKATESEKRALETQLAELRGKFSIIEQLNAPPQPEMPSVDTDILGVVKHQGDTIAALQDRLRADDDRRRADGEQHHLVTAYRMDAANFEARNPDFKAAYNHLLASRAAELQAMGYDDPTELHAALSNDEMSIARMALANRKSPAEIIYGLAQQRGYKKADGRGSERIDAINRGQQANKSFGNAGGSAGDGAMTAEALLKMPMDEFEAWCSKNPTKAKRLMGG